MCIERIAAVVALVSGLASTELVFVETRRWLTGHLVGALAFRPSVTPRATVLVVETVVVRGAGWKLLPSPHFSGVAVPVPIGLPAPVPVIFGGVHGLVAPLALGMPAGIIMAVEPGVSVVGV